MIWHNGWVHFQGQWFAPTGFSIPNQQCQKGKGKGKGKGNGKGKGKGDFQNSSRHYQVPNYAPPLSRIISSLARIHMEGAVPPPLSSCRWARVRA